MRSLNVVPSTESCAKNPYASIEREWPRAAVRRLGDDRNGCRPRDALTSLSSRTTAASSEMRRSTFAEGPGVAVGAAISTADTKTAIAARDRMPGNGIGRSRSRTFPRKGEGPLEDDLGYDFGPPPLPLDEFPLPPDVVDDCGVGL